MLTYRSKIALLLWVIPMVIYSQTLQVSDRALEKTYGYLKSNELLARRVGQKFPDLKERAYSTHQQFQSNFSVAIAHIDRSIRLKYLENYPELSKKLIDWSAISFKNLTRVEALNFLKNYEKMGRGIIKLPYSEILIFNQYTHAPLTRYYQNFQTQYEILSFTKTNLSKLHLKLPNNWKELSKKDYPVVLKKFRSDLGSGNIIFNLVRVTSNGGSSLTKSSEEILKEFIPETAQIFDTRQTILGGHPVFVVSYQDQQSHLNSEYKRTVTLYLFRTTDDSFLFDFSIYVPIKENDLISGDLTDLFDQIANTFKISKRPYKESLVTNKH